MGNTTSRACFQSRIPCMNGEQGKGDTETLRPFKSMVHSPSTCRSVEFLYYLIESNAGS